MIGRIRTDLRQALQLLSPSTVRALWNAGALEPSAALALGMTWPWLVGRGPSLGVVSRLNGLALGDKPAVRDRDGTLTWAELDRRANRAAHALVTRPLRGGDRVALLLRNGHEIAETLLGAQKVGVVACPMNTWAKPRELEATLEGAEASLLIYDVLHAEQVEKAAPEGLPLVAVGDPKKAVTGSLSYEELLGEQSDRPPFPFTLERGSARVVIHTSGTTGKPKGAERDAAMTGIREFTGLLSVVPFHRDDVIVCPAPMFHSFGLLAFTIASLLGATLVLPEKFDPEETLALIQEHRATAAALVPVMIGRITALPKKVRSRYDVSTLRILLASGSAIPEGLREKVRDMLGDVLHDLYGSTEAGWVAIATPQDVAEHPGTVGRPVPGVKIAVFSEEGERLPQGETGELHVKSGAVFQGYTSGETREQREGYMTLGDLGHLDEEGYLFVEGRADDMVVVGGENIYPEEIEEVIRGVQGVKDVAVVGAEDSEYGKVLAAFVVGSAGPEKIRNACKSELASFKVPRRVEKIDELPRTSTGKVLRRELAESLSQDGGS